MEIKIENLTKTYGGKVVLNHVSAVLTEGIYGILGSNGAGKSTLINILTDNIPMDSGEITLDGKDIFQMGPKFRNILGYMPQQQCFYENFTLRRFLGYMAALKGMKKERAEKRMEEIICLVNLKEVENKKMGEFSGGMKQRALIAQAILNDPGILILDEPTAGLDPKERIRIRNMISQLSKDKIVIIATHVVQDIEFIAKEILILKKGDLLYQKSTGDLQAMLEGNVYEITVEQEEVARVLNQYQTSNLYQNGSQAVIRVISETSPNETLIRQVPPSLEDVFLKIFGD